MKKTLAIVLALVMVFSLVPLTSAASTITHSASSYTLNAELRLVSGGSVENHDGSFTAKGSSPELTIQVPFSAIESSEGTGLWDDYELSIQATLTGINEIFAQHEGDTKIYVNGDEQSDNVSFVGSNALSFKVGGITESSTVFSFNLALKYEDTASDTIHTETVLFYINYVNTSKTVYSLNVLGADDDEVELADGIYYVDSPTASAASITDLTFIVGDNYGAKFTSTAYFSHDLDDYVTAWVDKKLDKDDSTIVIDASYAQQNPDESHEYYITVETQYGIYRKKILIKYRTNVERSDPKGVYFAQSSYTIGVGQILTPTYTTLQPVYHTLKPVLSVTSNYEKSVVDIQDGTIIGITEGTAYVLLTYTHYFSNGTTNVYTDTAKIIVSGTYTGTNSYTVTASKLFIRSGPGTSYSKLGSYAKGAVIEVLEISNGWAKIQLSDYSYAYVSASYIQKASSTSDVGTKYVKARNLNVRSGPGTSYSILGKLPRGTEVNVIETVSSGAWSKILYNGETAYISSAYIN